MYLKNNRKCVIIAFHERKVPMNFDFDSLYNECRRDTFADAKEIFYNDAVRRIVASEEEGKHVLSATVKDDGIKNVRIVFDETGGLYEYDCDCGQCDAKTGPCKHVAATALSYEDKHPADESAKGVPEKKSDADAVRLIYDYNRLRRRLVGAGELYKAELRPYLNFDNGPELSFTVGHRKQYIVKDIRAFISDFKECKYRRYGVALELYHNEGSFTEQSVKLIRFIEKCLAERGPDYSPRLASSLSLTGGELDKFFSLYEGKLVSRTRNEHWAFTAPDADFPLKITVKNASDGFLIKMNSYCVNYYRGMDWVYAVIGTRIFRIDEEKYNCINMLTDVLGGMRELFVSKADMVQFYNSVLKRAERAAEIDGEEVDLTAFAVPSLSCKIYLDGGDKCISAEVKAAYGDEQFDILSENYNPGHLRDWESEDDIRTLLAKYFPAYPLLEITDEAAIFEFLKRGVRELSAYAEIFMGENMNKFRIRSVGKVRVGVRLHSDILSVTPMADDLTAEEISKILSAYKDKQRYILLGGGFIDLDDRSLESLSEVLKDATDNRNGEYSLPSYYASLIGQQLKESDIEYIEDDAFARLIKDLSRQADDTSTLPPQIGNVLREYQKIGYNWLRKLADNNFGGILADDMGLGKTLQVIALLCRKKCSAIIVCPTTLLLNWQEEIKKFAPWLNVLIVMGALPERKNILNSRRDSDIIVTSYDLIRRDVDLYDGITFDYAVADEAQNIKNPDTKNAQAVKKLNARHKFALTGTPVENHLGELWSIFDFVMPGFLGSYGDFRLEYEEGIVAGDEDTADRFKKLIMPFVLRRLKSDVLKELPPKIESKLTCMLEGEQKSLYTANLQGLRHTLDVSDSPNRVEVLSMIMRLRQLCCDPALVYPDYNGNSAKLDSCIDLIASAVEGGHKVLLFSQFTSMLDIIKERLAGRNITFYLLTGDNPKSERLELVKKFNSDDTNVFLISLKAGGTGLNLTGADIVIHYDPWWNESVMNQATDRAYRIGQSKTVHVYKLILSGTLEESIYELQQKKSALSGRVVGQENNLKDIIKLIKQ